MNRSVSNEHLYILAMRLFGLLHLIAALVLALPAGVHAQVIDLTVNDVGLAIGDKPHVTGLRLNFRDRNLREVNGVNVTIWTPHEPATGVVNGLALGLPVTGASEVNGFLVGVLGGGVERSIKGIGVGGVGIGGGERLRGIMLAGVGVGSGGGIEGLSIGGVGVGSGGNLRGIQIGGLGVGGGGSVQGLSIAGIGVGGAGDVSGIAIGGIGVAGGSSFRGIGVGGIGIGGAGDMTGLMIGGIGVGSGGRINGLAVGGIGVGAPRIKGVAVGGLGVVAVDVNAIVLSAGYFRVEGDGQFQGASLATVTNVKGTQRGLTVSLFNYARELHGAQIGVINISDNGGHRRVLPVISVR